MKSPLTPLQLSSRESPLRSTSPVIVPGRAAKRKRTETNDDAQPNSKPAKSRKSKTTKYSNDEDLDSQLSLNLAIGKMNSRLLADYFAQRTERFSPDLSLIEINDLHVPEKAFHDTSGWAKSRDLPNLPSFLAQYSTKVSHEKTLSSVPKSCGAPFLLMVTSAGLRAADITRALRNFQTKDVAVAKLFAKHIKLRDAVKHVSMARMGIGVGTPSRIIDLIDAEALNLSELECIVIDCSHIDQKKRGILDIREIQQPLMRLLSRPELKARYGQDHSGVKLMVY